MSNILATVCSALIDDALGNVLSQIAVARLTKELRSKEFLKPKKIQNIKEIVRFAFEFKIFPFIPRKLWPHSTIRPLQKPNEIISLLQILVNHRPRFLMEIGTAGGGTLYLFTQIAEPDATIISIDLPKGPLGEGYPKWKMPLFKCFARNDQKIHLLRIDSHSNQSLESVKKILRGEKLDFLFIDGDHSYEGVKMDFKMYSPLVKRGGIVAFHDIVLGGASKFWQEIKGRYRHIEIVENWNQNGWGIGVIYV